MARLIAQGKCFEELAPTSLSETDFERIVEQQMPSICPDYHVSQFKALVYSEDGGAKPDLALIEKNYKEWLVIEVEMAHHSFEGHILPQVRALSRAAYGSSEARLIYKALPFLDEVRIADMLKGKQPRVLVVVNSSKPEWKNSLSQFNALVMFIEAFRSSFNEHIFRINGDRPFPPPDVISECYLDPLLPRFLVIESPSPLGIPQGGRMEIYYEDKVTLWQRVDAQDTVWLSSLGPTPLERNVRYKLIRTSNGHLAFKQKYMGLHQRRTHGN